MPVGFRDGGGFVARTDLESPRSKCGDKVGRIKFSVAIPITRFPSRVPGDTVFVLSQPKCQNEVRTVELEIKIRVTEVRVL